jgi:hypothetical protein
MYVTVRACPNAGMYFKPYLMIETGADVVHSLARLHFHLV